MYLAVDVGGTTIKFAVVDKEKNIIYRQVADTPDNVEKKITDLIVEISKEIRGKYSFEKVGISSAGVIDTLRKKVISATPTIKNYIGTDFEKEIGEKLDLEIFVDNDVNCALRGELINGAACGLEEVFCVALGTGIGGAYYAKEILTGSNFGAGEVGRSLYDPKTKTTYEQRASTIALANKIKAEYDENLSVKDFFVECRNENKDCLRILDEWLEELALGLVNILFILDPKYVVIGGAISKQGEYIINLIERKVREINSIKTNKTKFLVAQLDNDAALYGAISPFFN
ncbi:ROK family protein [Gemella sp. zg-1178]|uniref:ROK family protein n=1 Tax=Gemella sp. zg-1178 TaxID=2840372 RepID=UPI001C05ACD6|nr:ROK family protein [Gemella sp. zg-1178]MBU0278214.1 ROK family protein [Gemella sp. zg-1178]